jgi:hypothetical protein
MNTDFGAWRKSTRSDGGQNCVEVADAIDGSVVKVRDSKDRSGPALTFGSSAWQAFIRGVDALA